MTIKIQLGVPTYNKAPEPPKPPATKLFPIEQDGKWGKVWVSIPQPDKLWISGPVLPEQFPHKSIALEHYGPDLMASLATGLLGQVKSTSFIGDVYRKVQLSVGPNDASIFFHLRKAPAKSPAGHYLSVQLNPLTLGEVGFFELLEGMKAVMGGQFNFGAFVAAARVNRLDVAIDLIGVEVADLLVTIKGWRKQLAINGEDGRLETFSLYRGYPTKDDGSLPTVSKTNPLGQLMVVAYNKKREMVATGKPVKFGDAPHTRIEVRKTHFGPKPFTVEDFRQMPNPLAKLRVGRLVAATSTPLGSWQQYAELRRAGGKDRAEALCWLSSDEAVKFDGLYTNHPSDLLDAPLIWEHWSAAINETGLVYLIEAAEQKCAGVPLPPDIITEFG